MEAMTSSAVDWLPCRKCQETGPFSFSTHRSSRPHCSQKPTALSASLQLIDTSPIADPSIQRTFKNPSRW
ncbi:hypothetical protein K504DRAFT_278880 [Pleomassaria siparia CBS 279.74]|uniref:Uncharacterized protein n=1 Tax=Pleomassaria siparia CBS 279.74 TaxID=1314801 RepID=A0A6G1K9R6_9PLEO|nr:hypothetical protein K504DRAFT_278880 [Pleomassaria siparia CBS 279.74]